MTRLTQNTLLTLATALALLVTTGCFTKTRKEKLYFDEVRAPVGVKGFKVVTDLSMNPETGGYVTINTVINPDVDRDELDRVLKSLYRQARSRKSGFKKQKGKLGKIDVRVYDSEAKAKAAGDDYLGRAHRVTRNSEEAYENKQKLPLLKWGKKALGKGTFQLLADGDNLALEYSDGFIDFETKKEKEKINYESFGNRFFTVMDSLFKSTKQLKKCTYIRKHKGKVVAKIWLTREQYGRVGLLWFHEPPCKGCIIAPDGKTQCESEKATCTAAKDAAEQSFLFFLEKKYNAVIGPLTQELMSKEITEAKYIKLKSKQIRITLREMLSKLPKDQVELVKELR